MNLPSRRAWRLTTVKERVAGVGSMFPGGSAARTENLYAPVTVVV
jgi:hypothetical protein